VVTVPCSACSCIGREPYNTVNDCKQIRKGHNGHKNNLVVVDMCVLVLSYCQPVSVGLLLNSIVMWILTAVALTLRTYVSSDGMIR